MRVGILMLECQKKKIETNIFKKNSHETEEAKRKITKKFLSLIDDYDLAICKKKILQNSF